MRILRFVCTSDTHKRHRELTYPSGDVIIFAGDFTDIGSYKSLCEFNEFLGELGYEHKLVVTGNHDVLYEVLKDTMIREVVTNGCFLDNSGFEIDGISLWGTSFNMKLPQARMKYTLIPMIRIF